ncbi:RNA-binding protein [Pseudomonas sp. ABAC61]|nr:RNA-binding protein [Pseudomonas sp. ABAC61]
MAFRPLTARPPAVLLREAKPLKAILGHAQRLAHLQRLLDSQLQPAAREHCHVASWREGSLLLIVTDGHWATRLRYQQKRLQRQLLAFDEFAHLTRILFKVATADGISDPNLRAALERLASHARPRD